MLPITQPYPKKGYKGDKMNKTILHGNLGSDPELKKTDNGMAVANVSLATKEVWTKDGEKVEHTEWHRLVFWGASGRVGCAIRTEGLRHASRRPPAHARVGEGWR